jgi:hypothetical protein
MEKALWLFIDTSPKEGESLKEFMIWFTEKLKVEDLNKGVIFSAIYNGISPDELVARKFACR